MTSVTPRAVRGRRASWVGGSVAMFILGIMIDICGVVNVPGAAAFSSNPDDSIRVTGFGTALALLAIAAWVTVFWRERQPLLVVVVGGLLALIGMSYLLLLVGALAYSRRHPQRLRMVGIIVGSAVLLFAGREAITPWGGALAWFSTARPDAQHEPSWIAAPFICAVVALGTATVIALLSRARQQARQSDERARSEHRRADALSEQMVRQAERERIARDMHDALAHRLSVVSLHAGALEARAGAEDETGEIARTLREQTHAALQDMRGLIGDLRSGPQQSSPPTMRAIWSLLSDLRAGGTPLTAYVVLDGTDRASAQLDSAVFRIVQEALTNAIKHSPGVTIDLFVQGDPTAGVRIRVTNPVRLTAAPGAPGGHNGILGIRERASALGGTSWIGPHDGTFVVDVTLPWQDRD